MNTYKKLFSYAPEKLHCVYISIVLSVLSAVLLVLPFWYLWRFIEQLVVENDTGEAMSLAVWIVGFMLANAVVYFFALWASHLLAFRLESNLRKRGTDHLMKASFAFFDMNSSGKTRKLLDDNAAQTHMLVAHLIPDISVAIITPILLMVLIFFVDVRLGALLIFLTIIGLIQMKLMMGGQEFMKVYMQSLEKMNAEAVEYVRGMQVLKIFRTTVQSFRSFYDIIKQYSEYAYDYTMSCRKHFVSFQVIFNVIIVISVPFAIYFMNRGEPMMEILAKTIFFACFSGAIFNCFMRIMYVGMYHFQAQQVVEKLEGLFGDMEKGKLSHGSEEEMKNYDIEFCDVSFKYDREYVLENVNFSLPGHRTYALVGSSGGGKSTIAKLISGFYSLEKGEIKIGGVPLTAYTEEALMKNIAFVFQNAKLFKTSIYENVKMADEKASHEDVMEALKLARCEDILDKFPDRENTLIGAKGVHLSGGEIQRIAIARAILKDAEIVILDEASAAADPENEFEIQKAFSNLMEGKTVIMIAHRLSSIKNVDEILVINHGDIIERGTHEELTEKGGRYKLLQDMFSIANDWRVYDGK